MFENLLDDNIKQNLDYSDFQQLVQFKNGQSEVQL